MHRPAPYASLLSVGLIGLAGCSSESTAPAAVSDEKLSASIQPAEKDPGCDVHACRHVAGARLPLGDGDITVVGNGPFDMVSTAFVNGQGKVTAVYETYSDASLSSGSLQVATSTDCGKTFSAPKPLGIGPAITYETTPSAVRLGRYQYLYLTKTSSIFDDSLVVHRSKFDGDRFGEPEVVGPIPGVSSLLSWPRFIEAPVGLAVAFRTRPESSASFAASFDGLSFTEPIAVRPGERIAMPRTAFFRSGKAVYTYQTVSDDYWRYWSWWSISDDWKTWRDPVLVTTNSQNVHDTAPFMRSDGDIDLYYIYSSLEPTDTFKLYRRCLTRQGVLGPEQLVTAAGSPNKPNLERLAGGKVLLMYSDITQIDADGYPVEQLFKAAILAGDAPRP
jgi:hypothetical protein